MGMQMEELQLENHFYRYDLRDTPILQEKSFSILNDGEKPFLQSNQYRLMSLAPSELMRAYESSITNDTYLVIVIVQGYRFLFFIHDQPSFIAWRKEYEVSIPMLPSIILPPPALAVDANTTKIHIDAAAWRRTFRG